MRTETQKPRLNRVAEIEKRKAQAKKLDDSFFKVKKSAPKYVEVAVNEELNAALVTYIEAKREIEAAEERMKAARPVLEAALESAGGRVLYGEYKLSMIQFERESFRLNDAKEELGVKVLKPFITKSQSTRIDIRRKL